MPAMTANAIFWVGLTIRVTYRRNAATKTHRVERMAAPTIPSVWASNIAEMAPRQKPSQMA